MLKTIIRSDLGKQGKRVGKHVVKFQARGAYKVDRQEVATFAKELVQELKEAGVEEVMMELQDEDDRESAIAEYSGDVDGSMEDEEDRNGMWEYSQVGIILNSDGKVDPESTVEGLEHCQVDQIAERGILGWFYVWVGLGLFVFFFFFFICFVLCCKWQCGIGPCFFFFFFCY